MARSTGSTRSNAALSPPTMSEALPCASVTGLPEIGASSIARPLAGEFGGDRAARVRRDGAHVDVDAAGLQAGDDAVRAERDRSAPPRASVTIENTISAARRRPRAGVAATRMPASISGSALSRLRFQPVTAWPAAISLRHDASAHGAEADESDVHSFTSQRARS